MSVVEVLLIAVSVSIDALAVSIGGALCDRTGRRLRNAAWAALFFGGFQIIMPVIGFFAATMLQSVVASVDHWLAFVLLGLVGGKMIYEAIAERRDLRFFQDSGDQGAVGVGRFPVEQIERCAVGELFGGKQRSPVFLCDGLKTVEPKGICPVFS